MELSEDQQLLLKMIEERNNIEYDKDNLPATIELALIKLEKWQEKDAGVKSKSSGSRRIDFETGLPNEIIDLLNETRKVKW